MAEVRIAGVSKYFGTAQVLSDVTVDIADGELMILLGPSGCGKTTLLRTVAGLEDASSGDIFIEGRRVNDLAPHRRNVAMVFQSYALYPNLSVYENIAFPLRAHKTPAHEVDGRVRAAAERVGVVEFLRRKPAQLSGGQRQRIAIARAIVREPQVFLLDEPLSNLDAQLRTQMRAEFARLQRQLRTTTILVTHDQVEAMTMGDRITVMSGGLIQQIGTPLEIYRRPANTFVAGFIGSPPMNLVPARVMARDDGRGLALANGWIPLPTTSPLETDRDVIVGIRPEDLRIVPDGQGLISGSVDLIEYLGSETLAVVADGGVDWSLREGGGPTMRLHEIVHLSAAGSAIYTFDAATHELIGTLAEASPNGSAQNTVGG